jgi:hypothetical protein
MFPCRFEMPALVLSAVVAFALAAPPAEAQQPRPGQLAPGPAGPGAPQRGPAQAQPAPPGPPGQRAQQPAPPKPYKALPVTLPQPYNDPSFDAFRKQLGDIANRKDRAALARLVVNDFFWMGEKGDKANKRKSGIDNLASAIDLDNKDGSGWEAIAQAADEATLEPIPDRKGIMCSPASPIFDEKAADELSKSTGTNPGDWGYPSKAGLEVHASAQPNSPVIERLGMHLIRVMPEEPPAGAQPQGPSPLRVVTPSGKVGYVPEDAVSTLDSDQICYRKDASGWKIAGYAGND